MYYLGGKTLIGRKIAGIINKYITDDKPFYSLFTGSGGVEQFINANQKYYNDLHYALKPLYEELKTNWLPSLEECSELFNVNCFDYHNAFKKWRIDNKHFFTQDNFINYSRRIQAYLCLIGFGTSFSGKWLESFALTRNDHVLRHCFKGIKKKVFNGLTYNLKTFTQNDYKTYHNIHNSIIYCDPPYENVSGYSTGTFNNNEFFEFASMITKQNNIVFISECTCNNNDFIPIASIRFRRGLRTINEKGNVVNELLLAHKSLVEKNIVNIEPIQISFLD